MSVPLASGTGILAFFSSPLALGIGILAFFLVPVAQSVVTIEYMCYHNNYKSKEKGYLMNTNISKTIDISSDSAKYDASIKEMLADKQNPVYRRNCIWQKP